MKPDKPRKDFPLYPHGSGYWAKKIRGKTHYFGKWDDPVAAFDKYMAERDYLQAGVDPRSIVIVPAGVAASGPRLGDALNLYLDYMEKRANAGDLSMRSYKDAKATLNRVLTAVDRNYPVAELQPDHWSKIYVAIAKGRGPVTITNEITRIRGAMSWLKKNRHIDREPHYGAELDKPTKARLRRQRNAKTVRTWFDADEIKTLIAGSKPSIKAMIFLGVNCGLGNGDCAALELKHLDLKKGWLNFPRPKTGVDRRAKLWPETVKACQGWIQVRPAVTSPLLFVTRQGNPFSDPDSADCAIAKEFKKISDDQGVHIPGRGFYGLRRTCETIGGGCKDQVAVNYVMGHVDESMAGVYRQEIADDRLEAVSNTIRDWLFPKPKKKASKKSASTVKKGRKRPG